MHRPICWQQGRGRGARVPVGGGGGSSIGRAQGAGLPRGCSPTGRPRVHATPPPRRVKQLAAQLDALGAAVHAGAALTLSTLASMYRGPKGLAPGTPRAMTSAGGAGRVEVGLPSAAFRAGAISAMPGRCNK